MNPSTLVRRRKAVLGAGLAVGLACVTIFAGLAGAYPSGPLPLRTGLAWLESSGIGELTLVDGTAGAPVSSVVVGPSGTGGQLTQVGTTAYFLNSATGTVSRADAAQATSVSVPVLTRHSSDAILANEREVFVLDQKAHQVVIRDAGTLAAPRTLDLPERQTLLGPDGGLWSLALDGTVSWWDGGSERRSVGRAHVSSRAAMVLAGDTPVVVDPVRAMIHVLSRGTRTAPVDVLPDDRGVRVWGSAGDRFYIWARGRHILNVCSATTATCLPISDIAPEDPETLVEAWGKTLIRVSDTGLAMVDPTSRSVERIIALDPRLLEMSVRDGIVFLNNPFGPQAAVLRPDGRLITFEKYRVQPGRRGDPTHPPGTPAVTASGGPLSTGRSDPNPNDSPTADITRSPQSEGVPSPSPVPFTSPSGRQNRASPSPSVGTTGSPSPITQLTIAAITITPPRPTAGDPITFTADIHGPDPHTWSWTLQPINGPTQRTSDQPTLHDTITTPGTYTVTLHIKNDTQTAEHHQNFTVGAPPLTCGTTITVDTTLTTDLTCPTTALTIQGSSITLNLDGHTITGPGKTAAIAVSGDNNTITNGTITKYASAAKPDNTTPDLTLRSLTLGNEGAQEGFIVDTGVGAGDLRFDDCDIRWSGAPFPVRGNVWSIEMTGSRVRDTSMQLTQTRHHEFRETRFTDSALTVTSGSPPRLIGNTFTRSPVFMATVFGNSEISGNIFTGAGTGLILQDAWGISVTANHFLNNGIGLELNRFLPQQNDLAHPIVVQSNHFDDNRAAGVYVHDARAPFTFRLATITNNWLNHNGRDYGGTMDEQEKAVDDGIHIAPTGHGPTVFVAGNEMSGNGDRGIEADPDSVDNGGNNTSSGDENGCYPDTLCG
ncbi:right-handed parallel beta-helix repeat-containing protein [Streptosporangiaceae bacterium NEAU-GS5]|nr:right-handed parallel beta-helix repeat-containing protein [Streptosporangiaceae bacterium NEAU-GS5]